MSVLTLALVVVLTACSSSPATGSLKVTVTGLPGGVRGAVTVTGPAGYSKTVTATTTLANLALGTYSVAAAAASNGNAIVPTMYDGSASSSPVTVRQNTTVSTTVSYAARAGSGQLWVPTWGSSVMIGYQSGTLAASGSAPDVSVGLANAEGEAVVFDHAGNAWVSSFDSHIFEYTAASLASSGVPTPTVTITTAGAIVGMAFDASGNLWAGDYANSQVLEYTPAQLAAGGTPTPHVVITSNSGSIQSPLGMAFDPSGNLWVSNQGNSHLVEFTPAQLAAGGNPAPHVDLAPTATHSLSDPYGVAFDANGNLWVSNNGSPGTIVRFDASQLTTSGNPTPAASIAGSSAGSGPEGLAFDFSGGLWVADNGSNELRQFTNVSSLTGNVAPPPDLIITGLSDGDADEIAFSPPPPSTPINTP